MKQGLEYFTDLQLPLIGFIIFFGFFILLLILQSQIYNAQTLTQLSASPLQPDPQGEFHERQ